MVPKNSGLRSQAPKRLFSTLAILSKFWRILDKVLHGSEQVFVNPMSCQSLQGFEAN